MGFTIDLLDNFDMRTLSQQDILVFQEKNYVDKFGIKYYGYVIAKCCEMFFVEMNEQSASNA